MTVAKGTKRAANDVHSAVKAARAKTDKDTAGKYGCVKSALMAGPGANSELGKMLDSLIPLSLGVPQNKRHPFQSRIIDTLSKQLLKLDAVLKADISDAEREVKDAEALKEQHAAGLEGIGQALADKQSCLADAKRSLADSMSKFRDVNAALSKAEASLQAFDKQQTVNATKLNETEVALRDWLRPLNMESSLTAKELCEKRTQLLAFLGSNQVGLDESLLTALPAALEKAPDARGPFDVMTVQEVENVMTSRIAAMQHDLSTAGPRNVEVSSSVSTTQAERDEAAAKLRENAAEYRALEKDESKLLSSLSESKRAIKESTHVERRLTSQLDKANVKLRKFEEGPMSVFGDLRDHSSHVDPGRHNDDEEAPQTVSVEEVAAEPVVALPEMPAESVPAPSHDDQ